MDAIRRRGVLVCGMDQSEAEYSRTDLHGSRVAFDQAICRAVAVALMGTGARVQWKGYPDTDTALDAVAAGEVAMVPTLNPERDGARARRVALGGPLLPDDMRLMVARESGIQHATDLHGRAVCFLAESPAEDAVQAWFAAHRVAITPFPFQEQGEMDAAFATGNCAAIAGDQTRLAEMRTALGARRSAYTLLPEVLAPDALVSASGSAALASVVDATLRVLHACEQAGTTQATAISTLKQKQTGLACAAAEGSAGGTASLAPGWAAAVLAAVGNFGEVYERTLGMHSPVAMERGAEASPR